MVSTGSTNGNDGSNDVVSTGSTNGNDGSNDVVSTGSTNGKPVRVRMAPSPTGSPHVGLVRTALFNWAFARHHQRHGAGGTFILRIEDTDAARNTDESYAGILDLFGWLGLEWDEGPEVGGDHGPYLQSQRSDLYVDALARLTEAGHTYRCFCTNDEVEARRKVTGSKQLGYDRFCRDLTAEQVAAYEAEGRAAVTRFRMPDGEIAFDDLVRGRVSFHSRDVPDYALARANGEPLYTLVNPVDDALMEITHVLRGEDLLSSTPRQIPLYAALADVGIGTDAPEFGHLPYVMGQGNKKLSKRDPEANALGYREAGFLPEGLLNYVALLGWAIAADRDIFSLDEMADAFDIRDVNPNPARFDLKKADAINGSQMRLLSVEDITARALPFLASAGVVSDPITADESALLAEAMPLVAERINKLTEAPAMLGFLFVEEAEFARDEQDVAKLLDETGRGVVQAALEAVEGLSDWTTEAIQAALQTKLIEELGLKPRHAFGPVRVAITGRRISPPLFESMEILGSERSLGRLRSALTEH